MKASLDEIMKKKYSEFEVPNLDYNFYYKKKRKLYIYNVYKVAVVLVVFVTFTIFIKIISNKNTQENTNNIIAEEIVQNNNELSTNYTDDIFLPKPSETITVGSVASIADITSIAKLEVEYVAIVKVNKILGYTNYSKIQNAYTTLPITKLEVEVEDTLKGKLSGTIQINKPGGVITMSDYEKTLSDEEKERYGYNKKTEENKKNTYIEIISSLTLDMPEIEIGKSYLVFLRNDNEFYNGLSITGFFMKEYDKNTNSIKVKNTNETWEKVEDNFMVNQAIKK